jgi:serine/threonine-protein kinase RsbW
MTTKKFPARFENLAKISEFIAEAAEKAGLDETATYTVIVAVDEACSNIIEHAYGGESQGDIECTCDLGNDSLIITLRDWGKPFDPATVSLPDFSVPLEELEIRGAGLVLMQRIMDELDYSSTPEGENILRMVKSK